MLLYNSIKIKQANKEMRLTILKKHLKFIKKTAKNGAKSLFGNYSWIVSGVNFGTQKKDMLKSAKNGLFFLKLKDCGMVISVADSFYSAILFFKSILSCNILVIST
ncbi:MAG: hypothetical protein AB8B65_19885 [Kordia sp.]